MNRDIAVMLSCTMLSAFPTFGHAASKGGSNVYVGPIVATSLQVSPKQVIPDLNPSVRAANSLLQQEARRQRAVNSATYDHDSLAKAARAAATQANGAKANDAETNVVSIANPKDR